MPSETATVPNRRPAGRVAESLFTGASVQMVKQKFENLEIDFWVHRGKLGISQPSLCMFHDSVEIGSPILDVLNELKKEPSPAQRKLTFADCSRDQAQSSLRLIVAYERDDLHVMSIRCDSDGATIEMTDEGLKLLINACQSWLAGGEDFSVSPRHSTIKVKELGKLDRESGELWFWGPIYDGP